MTSAKRTGSNAVGHIKIDPEANVLGTHLLIGIKIAVRRPTVLVNKIVPNFNTISINIVPRLVTPTAVVINCVT
jgi:hypothetical protein